MLKHGSYTCFMLMYILCESDGNNYSGAGHVTLAGASHVTIN